MGSKSRARRRGVRLLLAAAVLLAAYLMTAAADAMPGLACAAVVVSAYVAGRRRQRGHPGRQ
jgi:hypothetical protein